MENWAPGLPVAQKDGVLPTFIPADLSFAMVAVRDVGPVAARALLDGPRGTRIIELSGPRAYSPRDVAAAAAAVLGRPVTVAEAPLDAVVPTFKSFGFSDNVAALFRDLFQAIARGLVGPEGNGAEALRAPTPIDVALRSMAAPRTA